MLIQIDSKIDKKQQDSLQWFTDLRNNIIKEFENIEKQFSPNSKIKFDIIPWKHDMEGGGEIAIMSGNVFEKIGVNISHIKGKFSNEIINQIPKAKENNGLFWATGISLVSHMCSPLVPSVHMNTRSIRTKKSWFGGGADLTPMYYKKKDYDTFHNNFKRTCDKYNTEYYPKYKKWADDYFYIQHRKEHRGIGGIFFDYLDNNDWKNDFNFVKDVGQCFLQSYSSIVKDNMYRKWTKEQREYQLQRRGRYVEFNLMYDRGTKFGLHTNGNVRSILMSMPPVVKWSTNIINEIVF